MIRTLKDKLSDNGRIIINTPNYEKNPYYYLMSDNYHFINTKIFKIFSQYLILVLQK